MRRACISLLLSIPLLAFTGCERLVSDSATRIAYQLRDEASRLRRSGATTRTFEHRPVEWPDGITGDYRIEFVSTAPAGDGRRGILVAKSYDGPTWSGTTYHLNFIKVPRNLIAAHRKGEPTLFTLELRDGQVLLTDMK
jgi:hypothetical protein